MHAGPCAQNHGELARTSPAGGEGIGSNLSLPAVEARTEQDGSALLRIEAAGGITAGAFTSALECGGTGLSGGHRAESQTAGQVPGATGTRAHRWHHLRHSAAGGKVGNRIGEKHKKQRERKSSGSPPVRV